MYIKEVVLEGFKSYAARTVISGWDSQFNAITGLNGSGKSNILDAICFVLGITTLSHVRAANLQDLVYKRGQAGIQKASVSIVFDNSDKANSPVGYTQCAEIVVTRQVVVGGKNKYLVNGHTTQQQVIQNLFQSVQLNVNNPHFLIMQGKITKVLNMKPMEILAMVEEAAGTRMFEERKDKALKAIAKKAKKLEEIQTLLREEIIPKLDRLRSERAAYLEYQQVQQEKERLERRVVLLDHARLRQLVTQSTELKEEKERALDDIQEQVDLLNVAAAELERKEAEMAQTLGSAKGRALEDAEAKLKQKLAKLETQHTVLVQSIAEEKARLDRLEKQRAQLADAVQQHEATKLARERALERLTDLHTDKAREVERTQALIVSLTVAAESGDNAIVSGFAEQLKEERALLATLKVDQETLASRVRGLTAEIAQLEPELAKAQASRARVDNDVEQLQQVIARKEAELQRVTETVDEERRVTLQGERKRLAAELDRLSEERDRIAAEIAYLVRFDYNNPTPNFNRNAVRGSIASLMTVDQADFHKADALEMAAGARLQNVVVDNEVVGSQLLKHGGLRKRVTLLPLNKIQGYKVGNDKINRARNISNGKAELALSLVKYDPALRPAMEHVFGTTFICEDSQTANRVTFDPQIKTKSVTWAGDVYDPSGVLSGGAKAASAGTLVKLMRFKDLDDQVQRAQESLARVDAELAELSRGADQVSRITDELDILRHRLNLVQNGAGSAGTHEQLAERLQVANRQRTDVQERLADVKARAQRTTAKIADLEKQEKEVSKDKTKKLDELKRSLLTLKKGLAKVAKELAATKVQVETGALETEQMAQDREARATEHAELIEQIVALEEQAAAHAQQVTATRQEHARVARDLAEERAERASVDRELQAVRKRKAEVARDVQQWQLRHKKTEAQLGKLVADADRAHDDLRKLLHQHAWLEAESQAISATQQQQVLEDGAGHREVQARLKELTKRFETLKRHVNVHVMEMIGVAEKREAELNQKLGTVLRDKVKIEETIDKLNDIKEEELLKTWDKVNVDFGKILADLLPGNNSAKLEPVDGAILQGLEVRVRLGAVWKESLTELSGGQRSLVALSLILALLQFKPAPMYILDEVDAALDLSHTQNIGQLIKNRFTKSQFIIVSLKEGMFSNAHVIFKTKFREGTSTVDRVKGHS
ncbi:Structural maintenance of chromosomes protein 2 [Allomyces javanicus]|nr:Structural maintenance of chromosomes protein 2 [Allomyces javanicus]